MLRIALRTLRFRKGAFVATFLAMTFGAVLVLACAGLMETGIRSDLPAQRLANTQFVVTGSQTWALPKEDPADPEEDSDSAYLGERVRLSEDLRERVSRVPGVAAAVGDVSVPVFTGKDTVDGHGWGSASLTPVSLASGEAPATGEVVLGQGSGAALGEQVRLVVRGTASTFTVSGLAPGTAVYFADDDVERLAGHPGYDLIGVRAEPGADLAAVSDGIGRLMPGQNATLLGADERGLAEYADAERAGENLIVLSAVFGGFATLVMLFVVATTLGLSIQQRQRELALLRAVGTTPGQLRRMVVGEALFMAVFAVALGCALGGLVGEWLFDQLAANGVVPPVMAHHSGWIPMVVASGAVLVGSFVASLVAGRKAARTRPTEALADAAIQKKWLSWVRVVLAVLAFGGGIALFIVTTAVMTGPIAASTAGPSVMLWAIALALVSPGITKVLLAVLRWPVRAVTGTAGHLATLSAKTRAVRMAAIVTPIMLATGMATANIYLQTTTVAVANEAYVETLRADLVLSSATGALPAGLVDEVRAVPGVTAASEFAASTVFVAKPYDSSLSEDGWPVQGVTGSAAAETTAMRPSEGSLADLTGDTIALPEEHAATLGRDVGDTITVVMGDRAEVDVRIVALYPAREGFETLLMPAPLVARHTTLGLPGQIVVRADDPAAVTAALGTALADHPDVVVADRDAVLDGFAKEQNVGAWINYLMAGMIIAYTAISVVNSLVMSTTARRREFGLQRLTGSTRGQVLRMMSVEAGMATVIGVGLGTVIAMMTLMPFTLVTDGSLLPTGPIAVYLGVAGAAAVLTFGSTLVSTWVGLRTRPTEAAVAPA